MENTSYRPDDEFNINGKGIGLTVLDFWQYAYSDLNADPRDVIAEFLVSNALGIKKSMNRQDWTLYDIDYKGVRVEVKCTGYFQTWREDGKVSERRNFSIRKAKDRRTGKYERHNDIYVFCLLNGKTREEANPLIIDNWDFYVVPTARINELCGDNNSISLSRVKKIADEMVKYEGLNEKIREYASSYINGNEQCTAKEQVVKKYIELYSPYKSQESLGINLVELTRYAKNVGKQPNELSEEEIAKFKK